MQVFITDYQRRWPALYQEEAAAIRRILAGQLVGIHHIGSTSVPGLAAKPIIDILPVVRDIEAVDACNPAFARLGYEAMGEFGIPGRRYFRKGGDLRTHQLHVFASRDEEQIRRHLAVRDYLRTHPRDAAAYAALKRALAQKYPEDIEGYCDGKDAFVQDLERRALAWLAGICDPGTQ